MMNKQKNNLMQIVMINICREYANKNYNKMDPYKHYCARTNIQLYIINHHKSLKSESLPLFRKYCQDMFYKYSRLK